jgi:hypothetical protein
MILFAVACNDADVTDYNASPEATITSHQGNETFLDGYVVTFRGSVSDADNAATELSTRWYVGLTEACAATTPSAEGISECDILLTEDDSAITLEVIDPDNAAGSTWLGITVDSTDAPTVEIIYPELGAAYYADQLVTFEGQAFDEEDDAQDLVFSWESSVDGVLAVEADPDKNGIVTGFSYLSAGDHAVTLSVSDTTGKVGVSVVTVRVNEANSSPSCEITEPIDGSAGTQGQTVLFKGMVSDVDIDSNQLTNTWSSDKDGDLGSSTADMSGSVIFGWTDLSTNTHVISLTTTDDFGATCTANIIYKVGERPEVVINSPATGDVFTVGEQVVFAGIVSDNEDLATDLDVEWKSDLSGVFSTSTADSSGAVNASTSSLSDGLHNITLTATDADGFSSLNSVQILLNNPPTVSSVRLNPAKDVGVESSLTCIASADDVEDGPLSASSISWTNDTTGASLTGTTVVALSSATVTKGDTVNCRAEFVDSNGATVLGSASVAVGNSAPSVDSVVISPNPAVAGDTLECTYTGFVDPDSDTDLSEYSWTVNGVFSGDSATLSGPVVGDVVVCTVTSYDGIEYGTSQSDSLTMSNSLPVLSSVTLSPDPATEGDTLTCTPNGTTDADGTTGFTYDYEWFVNGKPLIVTSSTLNDAYFSKSDIVACDVIPNDGLNDGAAVTSNTVTIANSLPSITSVTISPNLAYAGDTLTCSYIGFYDADADVDQSTYEWAVNGVIAGSSSTLYGAFLGSDTVSCTVTPFDGTDEGSPASYEIEIGNQAPSISSVSISPSPAFVGDVLSCTYADYYDADGDADVSTIAWSVNGSGAGTGANLSTSLSSGDVVVCSVTPYDGVLAGSVSIDTLTVSNTAPILSAVTLSPDPATESDTLSCTVGTTTDADGTVAFSYTYGWTVNSKSIGVTLYSLSGTYFDREDDVACTAVPTDGTDEGGMVTSNVVRISNTAPSIVGVTISPDPATESDTLTCTATGFTDIDGDADNTTYEWSVDGVAVSTSNTISGLFVAGSVVNCTATPDDGTITGLPMATALTIDIDSDTTNFPKIVSAGHSHTCVVDSTDAVVCWGDDDEGQSSSPAGIFSSISANGYHTCGIDSIGSVVCWGYDHFGQSSPPVGTFSSIDAGFYHTCGIDSSDAVACWGDNSYGQSSPPAGTFYSIAAGNDHTCGIDSSDSVVCWGDDAYGQSSPPVGTFSSVAAGYDHTCGIDSSGAVACWGDDTHGQSSPPAGIFSSISAGYTHTCGIDSSGSVVCWGYDHYGQSSPPVGTFSSIVAGHVHNCGIDSSGSVQCWGNDDWGQSTPPSGFVTP